MSERLRLGLQALAGAALVAIGLWLLLTPSPPGSPADRPAHAPALLSDVGGPIRLAVASVSSARRSPLRNADLVSEVVNALPDRAQLLVLTNDRAAFTTAGDTAGERVRFVEVDADSLTIWPQDPFLVLRDAEGRGQLLVPKRFDRAQDREMPRAVSQALGWPVIESDLVFEGGNVVSDGVSVFIGADTIRTNALELGVGEATVARRFAAELGRPVQVIGPSPQPVAHIDLVLTPLGASRLALADPAAGATVVAALLERDPDAVAAFERRIEEAFFGHPSIHALPTTDGPPLRPPAVAGRTAAIVAQARSLGPVFDRLAAELRARGFDVIRIPALLAPVERSGADGGDGGDGEHAHEERFVPGYPLLAFDNVLIVHDGDRRVVHLPRYGLDALDAAAAAAWREAGYETIEIDALLTSASYGGGLRCSVKVLERALPGS